MAQPNEMMSFLIIVALVVAFAAVLAILYILAQPASNGGYVVTFAPQENSAARGCLGQLLLLLALLLGTGIAVMATAPMP